MFTYAVTLLDTPAAADLASIGQHLHLYNTPCGHDAYPGNKADLVEAQK